jgi:hypothetical protein
VAKLRKDKGRLFIDFVFRGERCRESLHLANTPESRNKADALRKKLEAELALNTFEYSSYFPRSKRLARFGLAPKTELPTLGDYANRWLETRRAALKPATAHDYRLLLTAHILPSTLASSESTRSGRVTFVLLLRNWMRSARVRAGSDSGIAGSIWHVTGFSQCLTRRTRMD